MLARLLGWRRVATFSLLVLITEVAGRGVTRTVDLRLHVKPLADTGASYYPALLLSAKVVGALVLAMLAWRAVRAHASAGASERLLGRLGHRHRAARAPRLRPGLSPRIWLISFLSTSLVDLLHTDIDGIANGRWPLFAPLLHTYALPVYALLAVLVALAWRFASYIDDVEDYARRTFALAHRALTNVLPDVGAYAPTTDDLAPRRRFGASFESRPPPLPA